MLQGPLDADGVEAAEAGHVSEVVGGAVHKLGVAGRVLRRTALRDAQHGLARVHAHDVAAWSHCVRKNAHIVACARAAPRSELPPRVEPQCARRAAKGVIFYIPMPQATSRMRSPDWGSRSASAFCFIAGNSLDASVSSDLTIQRCISSEHASM